MKPLLVEGKVVVMGQKFLYEYHREPGFPEDPDGWVETTFRGIDVRNNSLVLGKPKGHEKFVLGRGAIEAKARLLPQATRVVK